MNSDELRSSFLNFYQEKGHKVIPSSSLVPKADPTLLLTSAGMVQIKPYFLGEVVPPSKRLASCQKCFRTTDIESVGDDTHLTFFEMLGNFSVGDYFKKETIAWTYEFITKYLKIPPERLWVTIFLDDDEAFGHWRQVGIPAEKIHRFGEEHNFWGPVGNSGPCGPDNEIFYDLGEQAGCGKPDCKPNDGCGRFIEISTLVFMQYNQDKDGRRTPLPTPSVDTGMGVERTSAILQGKASVYETDLYLPFIDCVSRLTGKEYGANPGDDKALRVVAEHGRALAFLIADGVQPNKVGRGYVLRRLLRRAQYFSETLSHEKPLLFEVAKQTISQMKHVYPELEQNKAHILKLIESEVKKFQKTLLVGKGILFGTFLNFREELRDCFTKFEKDIIDALSKQNIEGKNSLGSGIRDAIIDFRRDSPTLNHMLIIGDRDIIRNTLKGVEDILSTFEQILVKYDGTQYQAFSTLKQNLNTEFINLKKEVEHITKQVTGLELFILQDTYGFPVELTGEIVSKLGYTVDMAGFEKEMEQQRERSRGTPLFGHDEGKLVSEIAKVVRHVEKTSFIGYTCLVQKAKVIKLIIDGEDVTKIEAGQTAELVLDITPFYGEMGGQVGDTGELKWKLGRFMITNTVHATPDVIVHQGNIVEGSLTVGDQVEAVVDIERRLDIQRNHTATHLLQAALRQVLGDHIQQRGSLVAPEHLRFDFSHLAAMTPDEIKEVQRIVNDKIRQNLKVYDEQTDYKKAVSTGAIALFDEKYGDVVRVMRIGEPAVSMELCGGTHASSTGEIGYFHILSESSIGAGIRRIEAVTGRGAEAFIDRRLSSFDNIAKMLEASPEEVGDRLAELLANLNRESKLAKTLERELTKKEAQALLDKVEVIKGVNVLSARVSSSDMQIMREMADYIKDKLKSVIIILGAIKEDGAVFVVSITPDLVEKGYNAKDIINDVSKVTRGGGGGRVDFAQAGGRDKNKLDEALHLVKSLI